MIDRIYIWYIWYVYMISAWWMFPVIATFRLAGGHGKERAIRKALSRVISQETRHLSSCLLGFLNPWACAQSPHLQTVWCSVSTLFQICSSHHLESDGRIMDMKSPCWKENLPPYFKESFFKSSILVWNQDKDIG